MFGKKMPSPAVFAVGDEYQIMVPVARRSLMWAKVNGKDYFDDSNGIIRSLEKIHRICVPAKELDKAGEYTICERKIIWRKPYFPLLKPETQTTFKFRPVKAENPRAYHISDTHNQVESPVKAAKAFGEMDFLILNGDIPNHSGHPRYFRTIYEICSQITHGNIPVVFARGNHDLRGLYAEKIADYTPNLNGKTYYTFRLGSIWGIVLDCGEDKPDDHEEYGGTVCCHFFREKQTAFLENVVKNAENEYLAEGVTHRLVICHNPFSFRIQPPFDVEDELFTYWSKLLKENVRPDVMICGHTHKFDISEQGSKFDHRGQPCTMVIGTEKKDDYFACAGFEFGKDSIDVYRADSNGKNEKVYTIRMQ